MESDPIICRLLFVAAAFGATGALALTEDEQSARRRELVAEIDAQSRDGYAPGIRAFSPRVMQAMAKVKRHLFVPESQQAHAYENRPLPIGYGQTISQPYIVALMTELLRLEPGDRVLEVGTGSGYQAAILAELVKQVYSVEIVEPLAREGGERLRRLGYANVETRHADGYYGWADKAPFDAMIVTAAATHIPPPLVQQLKPGGRMLIPVGASFMVQQLVLVEKQHDGTVRSRQLVPVRFVPLTGGR